MDCRVFHRRRWWSLLSTAPTTRPVASRTRTLTSITIQNPSQYGQIQLALNGLWRLMCVVLGSSFASRSLMSDQIRLLLCVVDRFHVIEQRYTLRAELANICHRSAGWLAVWCANLESTERNFGRNRKDPLRPKYIQWCVSDIGKLHESPAFIWNHPHLTRGEQSISFLHGVSCRSFVQPKSAPPALLFWVVVIPCARFSV